MTNRERNDPTMGQARGRYQMDREISSQMGWATARPICSSISIMILEPVKPQSVTTALQISTYTT